MQHSKNAIVGHLGGVSSFEANLTRRFKTICSVDLVPGTQLTIKSMQTLLRWSLHWREIHHDYLGHKSGTATAPDDQGGGGPRCWCWGVSEMAKLWCWATVTNELHWMTLGMKLHCIRIICNTMSSRVLFMIFFERYLIKISNPKTRNQLVFLFCGTRHCLAKYNWLKSSFNNSEYNLVSCAVYCMVLQHI